MTHIHYKLHVRTNIIQFNFQIYKSKNFDKGDQKYYGVAIRQWLEFFFEEIPTLDNRWCGGHFGHNYLHLLYCGDYFEAKKTFLKDFLSWYDHDLRMDYFKEGIWGPLYSTIVYDNWYDYT